MQEAWRHPCRAHPCRSIHKASAHICRTGPAVPGRTCTEPSPLRSPSMNQGDCGMPRRSLRYLRGRAGHRHTSRKAGWVPVAACCSDVAMLATGQPAAAAGPAAPASHVQGLAQRLELHCRCNGRRRQPSRIRRAASGEVGLRHGCQPLQQRCAVHRKLRRLRLLLLLLLLLLPVVPPPPLLAAAAPAVGCQPGALCRSIRVAQAEGNGQVCCRVVRPAQRRRQGSAVQHSGCLPEVCKAVPVAVPGGQYGHSTAGAGGSRYCHKSDDPKEDLLPSNASPQPAPSYLLRPSAHPPQPAAPAGTGASSAPAGAPPARQAG